MQRNKFNRGILILFAALMLSTLTFGSGPLVLLGPNQPFKFDVTTPVKVYTDLGPFRTIAPAISNERADEITAFAYKQWTDVPTSNFQAQVVGDFGSLPVPLPDINSTNAGLVIGTNNGGGIHVIYDTDGTIMRDFFGVGNTVLGIASPEFADGDTAKLIESWVVINGRTVATNDPNGVAYAGVFTHEFGHSINLAHSQVNGAALFATTSDPRGPAGCASLPYPTNLGVGDIETMYPFLNINNTAAGTGVDQSTVNQKDDISSISDLYPTADYAANSGSITGRIRYSNGDDEIRGVNVIARNIANPYGDAVSAVSGDFTRFESDVTGEFYINGLTPGAQYVVYVDALRSGSSYPTTGVPILPGAEEFYNGAGESGNGLTDDPCSSEAVVPSPGQASDASITFNAVKNGPELIRFGANTNLTDLSRDGSTAVGVLVSSPSPSWKWSRDGGLVNLGGTGNSLARISPEGGYIVSSDLVAPNTFATSFWTGGTSWSPIPPPATYPAGAACSQTQTFTTGISENGGAVTGLTYDGACTRPRAFKWTSATGTAVLPVPDGTTQSRANNVSADGNTVTGWFTRPGTVTRGGAAWINGEFLPLWTAQYPVGEANSATPDGSMVVGAGIGTTRAAWKWTPTEGVTPLGNFSSPANLTASALDISDDGRVIVGFSGVGQTRVPFIWTKELGFTNLSDFLQSQGTFLGPYLLSTPTAVSGDGSVIGGWSLYDFTSWILDFKKVVITHAPPGNPTKTKTIVVGFDSLADHLKHGDTIGITYSNN